MAPRNGRRPVFYRLRQGKRLHAFGDEILDVPVLGTPLGEHQRVAVEENGCELREAAADSEIRERSCFVFDEDLFFTPEFVARALELASKSTGSLCFGLAPNSFNERFVLPHEPNPCNTLRFNIFYRNGGDRPPADAVVPQEVFASAVNVPDQIVRGGAYSCDQCSVFCARIASPFHLLQVNLAANFKRLARLRGRFSPRFAERLAPLHSRLYVRSLKRLNRLGRGCRIHPTAVLENAILENGVIVGANSIVRHSHIGAGTTINDNASIVNSVLGKHNVIASGNHINLCMTYEEVFLIHGPYQFSIFGRSSAVFAVINCDIRLDQKTISIPTDSGLLDSKQPLLGIAYGHHSKVGGGNIIAAGRIVPNHKRIDPPSTIILKVE
jgi:carbonic anhydrase/acetyltransferase-like protein (isoleucine patch superfamily)